MSVGTSAYVTVEMKVDVGSQWGPECKLEQVYKQAAEAAVGIIKRMAHSDGRVVSIVSTKVTAVTTRERE